MLTDPNYYKIYYTNYLERVQYSKLKETMII